MERYRCACCACHTLVDAQATCPLCFWSESNGRYALNEARDNVDRYGVMYRPTDERFAVVRHPILGPSGEYAVDRVALRARAYIEFRAFGKDEPPYAALTERLQALLNAVSAADRLYSR
jgi:hypothetical protein